MNILRLHQVNSAFQLQGLRLRFPADTKHAQKINTSNNRRRIWLRFWFSIISAYGHIEKMAYAVAEGAKSAGADVTVKRVPELVPERLPRLPTSSSIRKHRSHRRKNWPEYDAIIVGSGTRFGTVTSQMRNFWDQTGGLWFGGKLVGKVGSVFTSSATQHGGRNRPSSASFRPCCTTAWPSSAFPMLSRARWAPKKSRAASPTARPRSPTGDGSRQPSEIELEAAKYQGAHVAKIACQARRPIRLALIDLKKGAAKAAPFFACRSRLSFRQKMRASSSPVSKMPAAAAIRSDAAAAENGPI